MLSLTECVWNFQNNASWDALIDYQHESMYKLWYTFIVLNYRCHLWSHWSHIYHYLWVEIVINQRKKANRVSGHNLSRQKYPTSQTAQNRYNKMMMIVDTCLVNRGFENNKIFYKSKCKTSNSLTHFTPQYSLNSPPTPSYIGSYKKKHYLCDIPHTSIHSLWIIFNFAPARIQRIRNK